MSICNYCKGKGIVKNDSKGADEFNAKLCPKCKGVVEKETSEDEASYGYDGLDDEDYDRFIC